MIWVDTLSDYQLAYLDKEIIEMLKDEDFKKLYEPVSTATAASSMNRSAAREDVEEGNWGTLYRNPTA